MTRPSQQVAASDTEGAAVLRDGTFELFGDREKAARLLSCWVDGNLYPVELCATRWESPGALARAVAAAKKPEP
jgi:hypothetical protein